MPDGHRTPVLVPNDDDKDAVLQPADEKMDVSKSNKTDAERLADIHKKAADQMFGDRTPMEMEVQANTPERPADGK